jgi:hypothetical protein
MGIHISAYSGGGYFAFPMCLSLYACRLSRGDCGSDVSGEVIMTSSLTMRCSEPGHRAPAAIVACLAPVR